MGKLLKFIYTVNSFTDAQGVEHREHGSFTFADGTQSISNTLWFDSDHVQSVPIDIHNGEGVEVSADIAKLPNAVGFGNVYALRDAMQRETSGKLQALVKAFAQETDIAKRHDLVEQILIVWAKQDGVDPSSRGTEVNGQHVGVMEAFWGQDALQVNPSGRYAVSVKNAYADLSEYVYAQLSLQSHYRGTWSASVFTEDNGTWTADFSNSATWIAYQVALGNMDAETIADVVTAVAGIVPDNNTLEKQFIDAIEAQAKDMPDSIKNTLRAGVRGGDDNLSADDGDNSVNAGAGNDHLTGSDAADVLSGGAGNDRIDNRDEDGSADTLYLHAMTADDVAITRSARGDLLLEFADMGSVTVDGYFNAGANSMRA